MDKPHPVRPEGRTTFSNKLEKDPCGTVGSFDCGRGGVVLFLAVLLLFSAFSPAVAWGACGAAPTSSANDMALRFSSSVNGNVGFSNASGYSDTAAGSTGDVVYDSTNKTLAVCNGTAWSDLANGIGSQWITSGSNIYYNSGSVGIGTTSPVAVLDVEQTTGQSWGLFVNATGVQNPNIVLGLNGAAKWNYGYDITNNYFKIAESNVADRFVIANGTGYVGIGTTSPRENLDIEGSTVHNGIKVGNSGGNYLELFDDGNAHIEGTAGTNIWINGDNTGTVNLSGGGGNTVINANNGGNVGIGTTTPGYPLHVNGTAYATGAAGALSDIRHKDDVRPLPDELATVMKLRPVSFKWKTPTDDGMKGEQIGFIAQEVETVLPSVVLTQNDKDKTKGLKYTEIIPVLTKAMQELKSENDALSARIERLEQAPR